LENVVDFLRGGIRERTLTEKYSAKCVYPEKKKKRSSSNLKRWMKEKDRHTRKSARGMEEETPFNLSHLRGKAREGKG